MFSGQIADGLTTPLVGFLSDKTNTRIGRVFPWYIFGTILVVPTFLGIFIYPDFGELETLRIAYYVTLPAIFNVGINKIHFFILNRVGQCVNCNHGYC